MKLQLAVCDDEKSTCVYINELIKRILSEELIQFSNDIFYSGEDLLSAMESGKYYDIIFLDIELLGISGVETAQKIRESLENARTQIVFISGKTMYALELFQVQPLDFVIKPIDETKFKRTLLKGVELLGDAPGYIACRKNKDLIRIEYKDIMYFENSRRQVNIYSIRENGYTYGKIDDVISELPECFVQTHKSYAVNLRMMKRCSFEEIELVNGCVIPISRAFRNDVRRKILEDKLR